MSHCSTPQQAGGVRQSLSPHPHLRSLVSNTYSGHKHILSKEYLFLFSYPCVICSMCHVSRKQQDTIRKLVITHAFIRPQAPA